MKIIPLFKLPQKKGFCGDNTCYWIYEFCSKREIKIYNKSIESSESLKEEDSKAKDCTSATSCEKTVRWENCSTVFHS